MAAKKKTDEEIRVLQVHQERVTVILKGTTPLVMRRLSEKAKRELLLPSPKKTQGDKQTTLKHDPYQEFQDSPYKSDDPESPTLLLMPSTAIKNAMRSVAVDIPNASSKAQLGRLTYVEGEYVPVYGTPQLKMDIVRSADMNRTPDVRTRVIVPEWIVVATICYITPILNGNAIVNLIANAGIMQGIGDGRPEKGKLSWGTWSLIDKSDPDYKRILKSGRAQQLAAMKNPACYDAETEDLLSWFEEESDRRGFKRLRAV